MRFRLQSSTPTIKNEGWISLWFYFIKEKYHRKWFSFTPTKAPTSERAREEKKFLRSTCAKNGFSFKSFCLRLSSRARRLLLCWWLLWVLRKNFLSSSSSLIETLDCSVRNRKLTVMEWKSAVRVVVEIFTHIKSFSWSTFGQLPFGYYHNWNCDDNLTPFDSRPW